MPQLRRWRVKRRKRDLATEATHAKDRKEEGRPGKALIKPMQSITIGALHTEGSKVMHLPSRVKRTTCNGNMKERLQSSVMISTCRRSIERHKTHYRKNPIFIKNLLRFKDRSKGRSSRSSRRLLKNSIK